VDYASQSSPLEAVSLLAIDMQIYAYLLQGSLSEERLLVTHSRQVISGYTEDDADVGPIRILSRRRSRMASICLMSQRSIAMARLKKNCKLM
jgi:hypothetical protein